MGSGENDHLPDEILAAFVDGKLSRKERATVIAHLDACPDCYEVFAETVRFVREEEPSGEVVTFEREYRRPLWNRPLFRTAVAVAAVLLVVVILPGTLPERVDPADEALLTARLARSLGDHQAAALAVGGTADAGTLGFGSDLPRSPSAFRVGVRLTDLRVALASGDKRAAEAAAAELEPAAPAVARATDRFRWRGATRRAIAELERSYARENADKLEEGARAEAGRLAAATGDGAFFRTEEGRAVYDTLAQRLGERVPGLDDLDGLESAFEEWISSP